MSIWFSLVDLQIQIRYWLNNKIGELGCVETALFFFFFLQESALALALGKDELLRVLRQLEQRVLLELRRMTRS